jgi:predicted RNA-binding Zn-ribbon protein involved in translation (DUF1610 family)
MDPNHIRVGDAAALVQCTACDYDLTAHSDAHRCPECGLDIEPGAMVFRPARTRRRAYLIFGAIFFAYCILRFPRTLRNPWTVFGICSVALFAFYAILKGKQLLNQALYRHSSEFLRLGSKDIRWRINGHPEGFVARVNIIEIRGSEFLGMIVILQRGSPRRLFLPPGFKPKDMHFKDFLNLLRAQSEGAREFAS